MVLTAAIIATATGGTLAAGAPDRVIDGFAIDSRTLQPGDLFFAIEAARDGHDFVGDAIRCGASGAIVRAGFKFAPQETRIASLAPAGKAPTEARALTREADEGPGFGPGNGDPVLIEVADTTLALQNLARFVRRESSATVIAITGSAGKTTTKETIAEFLSGRYRVIKNKGNLNNHLGLPLSLLELRRGADVAVMELGMNHSGEIRVLVGIAEPEVRVWTNVGDAHLGFFASRDALADAKAEVLEGASAGDVAVYNADDPLVAARAAGFEGRTITFGTGAAADVRADRIEDLGLAGMRMRVHAGEGDADLALPLVGRGNLMNALAATAVALELGVPLGEIVERAARLSPAPHRGAVVRLARGVTILDDSYNSSPAALERALDAVAHERGAARKAAVLGEMLELGEHAIRLHQASGAFAARAGLDRLIAVGGDAAKAMADAAVQAGMNADAVTWTASSDEASTEIVGWLNAGDVVLVKGSRGIKTDRVVDRITAEFS